MSKDQPVRFPPAERIAALAVLFALALAAVGFERKETHASDIFSERAQREADILRVERKLDCALFNLPADCKKTMAPR